jgi:hypothetical protein
LISVFPSSFQAPATGTLLIWDFLPVDQHLSIHSTFQNLFLCSCLVLGF